MENLYDDVPAHKSSGGGSACCIQIVQFRLQDELVTDSYAILGSIDGADFSGFRVYDDLNTNRIWKIN